MHSFETLEFYRGVSDKVSSKYPSIIRTRKDRKPRDTPIHIHEWADSWFKTSFGVGYRSQSVLVTPNRVTAQFYGTHCVRVIPLGNYSFCWSKKYADFLHIVKDGPALDILTARLRAAEYGTADLALAHQSGNELMLCCDSYIAVPLGLLTDDVAAPSSSSIILASK